MDAEVISEKSMELINTRGFCFWRCAALDGDIIAICRNGGFWTDRALDYTKTLINNGKLKELPTAYTVAEVKEICKAMNIKLIHEGKKLGGTVLPSEPE